MSLKLTTELKAATPEQSQGYDWSEDEDFGHWDSKLEQGLRPLNKKLTGMSSESRSRGKREGTRTW
jgi:hypothetical protein